MEWLEVAYLGATQGH